LSLKKLKKGAIHRIFTDWNKIIDELKKWEELKTLGTTELGLKNKLI
jgi:hypothetical protein